MRAVLDASAVLAALLREPGRDVVAGALAAGSIMCSYNLAEVATRYAQLGASEAELRGLTSIVGVELVDSNYGWSVRYNSGLQNFGIVAGCRNGQLDGTREAAEAFARDWVARDPARRYAQAPEIEVAA